MYTSTENLQLETHRYQLLATETETEREGESVELWEILESPVGRLKLGVDEKETLDLKISVC